MGNPRLVLVGLLAIGLGTLSVGVGTLRADMGLVGFPENYAARFVRYATVDKPDRDPAAIRFLYISPEALAMARPGEPLPDGTVLVMEDHKAAVGADGRVILDSTGRLVPTDLVTNVFVQEKRTGWGAEYPPEMRNGEWEYAWFEPDGARKPGKTMERCFECHKSVAKDDFTFTASQFVARIKN